MSICSSPVPEVLFHGSEVIHSRYVRETMYSAEAGVIFASRFSSRSHSFFASADIPDSSTFLRSSSTSVCAVVGFAQFLLNRLHLLAQQEFALALVHLLLHLLVNLVAQLEDFLFFGKLVDQRFQALANVECFEQLLAHHGGQRRQRRSDEIRQPAGESMFMASV